MIKFHSLVDYLKNISKTNKNSNSIQVRIQFLRCNYTKFQSKILIVFRYVLNFPGYPVVVVVSILLDK